MLSFIVNWINTQAPKNVIARHLAKVAQNEWTGTDALYPEVGRMCNELVRVMESKGKPIQIVETFRTTPRQNSLSGNVTNAGGLQSYHQYGLAFDVMFKRYRWSPPDNNWWDELGEAGESLGLIWGGRWKMRDMGHFEWHGINEEFNWKTLKPHFKV